jgi:hypothetical protein
MSCGVFFTAEKYIVSCGVFFTAEKYIVSCGVFFTAEKYIVSHLFPAFSPQLGVALTVSGKKGPAQYMCIRYTSVGTQQI